MPSFSPSFSNRLLVAVGTGALLVLIVILITGGFVFDAGPLHVSARRIPGPLVIALVAWSAAFLQSRTHLAASAVAVFDFVESHAGAIAIVLAAAAAGIGVAYGTYAATGSDASGYISQAELLASGRLVQQEPLARQGAWREGTWTFTPLGYRPGRVAGELVPTYAPGLPLVMAVTSTGIGELGAFLAVPILGALAVFCTYALGATLCSRKAGVIAAALLATSPIFLFQIVQPMSDVPVTAWWALSLWLALSPSPRRVLASGLAAALALLTRPNLLPLVLPVLLAAVAPWATAPRPSRLRRGALVLAGIAPACAAIVVLQAYLYGNPLSSGYGRFSELFTLSNVVPNALGYAARLVAGEGPALFVGMVSLLLLTFIGRRSRTARMRPAAMLAVGVWAALLVCYLPYAVFSEWAYLRFFLPAWPLTFVLVAAVFVDAVMLLPASWRGVVALAVLTALCSVNVVRAGREQAFNLRRYDARYRLAGRYLDAVLPDQAVVFAVQQSGSVRHYAHVPIVRWDLIGSDLDGTVAALVALGRRPVFLIEDWEKPDFAARFRDSTLARLDWSPQADIGDDTRALLYEPADRNAPSGRGRLPDRVH